MPQPLEAVLAEVLERQAHLEAGAARVVRVGGNGIVLDFDVIRYFNDAEALYSYEGTREMNTLIVGRSITGMSAFV